MSTKFVLAILTAVFCCLISANSIAAEEFRLPEQLPDHPRIIFTATRQAEIEELAKSDQYLATLISELLKKADRMKTEKPSEYLIPDGKRLLSQSRRSLERTSVLAFAFRMSGKKEYADAAIEEMLTVCRFKDWNPSHYLDTAEMATAVGIGYDWLYGEISETDRKEIRESIIKHAFNTGLQNYEKQNWWVKTHNNWNEVCNSGLTIAALAIAEDTPAQSEKILAYAIKSIPNGLSVYKPDGAYPEGPAYWDYGCTFSGLMIASLLTAFDSDFDLLKTPGFDVTGDYYMNMIGPTYRNFNYADCGETAARGPMMFFLSRAYDRPDYARWVREFLKQKGLTSGRFAVFGAVWYNPETPGPDHASHLAKKFSGIQDVVAMRTSWTDPDAAFVGFKGGDNKANHGHLDIGSFVYDNGGVRWAVDLGGDDYNMPGYFGAQRWDYYRNNTKSHNTLLIDGKNQDTKAVCKIVEFEVFGDNDNPQNLVARAVCDMTEAYKGQASSARRTLTLEKSGGLRIIDELEGVVAPVRWGMVTRAKIEIQGSTATLSQAGKKMLITFDPDQIEKIEAIATTPEKGIENLNRGTSMLAAVASTKDGKVKIVAVFDLRP